MTKVQVNIKELKSLKGVFTDFDGTISEISSTPDSADIKVMAKKCLNELKKIKVVGIVSGRPLDELIDKVGIEGIYYVGNHGAEIIKNGDHFVFEQAKKAEPLIKEVYDRISTLKEPYFYDYKRYSASVHYRLHPKPMEAEAEIMRLLEEFKDNPLLHLNKGRKVIEIKVNGVNKAVAMEKIIKDEDLDSWTYFGDDTTDIDVFRLKKNGQFNFAVSNPEADPLLFESADMILQDPDEVVEILCNIVGCEAF